jgi:nucleoside-diphosphate-sugar epimerase
MPEFKWSDGPILVTGARGFIGSQLVARLVSSGATVYGMTARTGFDDKSGAQWVYGEVADATRMSEIVAQVKPTLVFHLAGHVTGSQQLGCVAPTFMTNLSSTVHLMTAAAELGGCRIVLAGSMREPDHDTDVPCSPYAASKWASSAYARMFHALYNLPVVVARLFMVYGPGQWDLTKVLPYVTVSLLRGESPRVGSGAYSFDWVYIDDVVDALLCCARYSEPDARSIDVGTGTLTSVRTLIERVVDVTRSDVAVQFGAIADRVLEPSRVARVEETKALIGWSAQTALDDGLARTVAWYRSNLSNERLHVE